MNQQSDNLTQSPIISQETSMRITSLRFLLAMFVVFIHNNLNADTAINYYHLDFIEPVVITWIKTLVCRVLGGAAVPLFFMFAGYLQFRKNDTYPVLLKKKAKSLLAPYVIWTIIAVLAFFIGQSIPRLAPFFQNENNIVRDWNITDWINLFWTHIDNIYPLMYQFWFVRNLMIIVIVSPLLTYFAKKIPFAFIIVAILFYVNGFPLGLGTALFFYMCGYFFAEYDIDFFSLSDKISWLEFAILILFEMMIVIVYGERIKLFGLGTIISCLFFLKLSGRIIAKPKVFSINEYLAGFSFFLYAIHAPFLVNFLNKISYRIIPLHGLGCLVQFVLPPLITITIGTLIGIILKKIYLPLFALLNGGRK